MQYVDTSLTFAESTYGINFIHDEAGVGKKNLCKAIQWVLIFNEDSSEPRNLININAIKKVECGSLVECKVTLVVTIGDIEYEIHKELFCEKKAEGELGVPRVNHYVTRLSSKGKEYISKSQLASLKLERMLFFGSEQCRYSMEEYAKERARELSDIKEIEKSILYCTKARKRLVEKEVLEEQVHEEIEKISARINEVDYHLKRYEHFMANFRTDKERYEEELKEIEKELHPFHTQDMAGLTEKKSALQKTLTDLCEEMRSLARRIERLQHERGRNLQMLEKRHEILEKEQLSNTHHNTHVVSGCLREIIDKLESLKYQAYKRTEEKLSILANYFWQSINGNKFDIQTIKDREECEQYKIVGLLFLWLASRKVYLEGIKN